MRRAFSILVRSDIYDLRRRSIHVTTERLKTKEVAKALGVSPSTVLNWVKKYHNSDELNENGHYLFTETELSQLRDIQNEKAAKPKEEPPVSAQYVEERLAKMEEKIKILEAIVSNKADDIVTFQLVEHRKTVRDIQSRLQKIEAQMVKWESEKSTNKEAKQPKEKPFLANLFSL